jgi:hypothetical protein
MLRRPVLIAALVAAALGLSVSVAWAFVVITSSSTNASGTGATIGAPGAVTITSIGGTATVTWSAPTTPTGASFTYTVARSGGTGGSEAGGCAAASISGASCQDTNATAGQTFTWTVTPHISNWDGGTSTSSAPTKAAGAINNFLVAAPSSANKGTPFTVTVTARDSANTTITGYTGTVHFTSTNGTATLPANTAFAAGDLGVHTFTNGVTLNSSPGPFTVSVNDTVTTSATGTSGSIAVTNLATTSLTASGPASATTAISASAITATLSSGSSPTGTMTLTVFGPLASAPTTCTSGGLTVGTATVSGNAAYHPSAGFIPTATGTYWWYASYSGDSNNLASNSTCGTGMSSTSVTAAPGSASTCGVWAASLAGNSGAISYTIVGAGGGAGNGSGTNGGGGSGASVTGTLNNTNATSVPLSINIGCAGGNGGTGSSGHGTASGSPYASGGNGGNGHSTNDPAGGAGGGTTSIEIMSGTPTFIVVAGGGGGGGGGGGSSSTGSSSTGTSSSITAQSGSTGTDGGSNPKNGGGGGGGGVGTTGASGGGIGLGGSAGLSYNASNGTTVNGVVITAGTPTSGSNGGAAGSVGI